MQFTTNDRQILKIRSRIGDGLKISINTQLESIELENNCELPVYWLCPGFYPKLNPIWQKNAFSSNRLEIKKSTTVYNHDLINLNDAENDKTSKLIFERHIINVSFGKYWGHDSKTRNSIEYCPCWLNISVNPSYFQKFCP